MITEKPKLVPLILQLLKENGKAKFDFGTFNLVERNNGVVKLLTTGKVKKIKPYKALFFSASETLKKELKKYK
jgi:nucleoid DNA-binding protein